MANPVYVPPAAEPEKSFELGGSKQGLGSREVSQRRERREQGRKHDRTENESSGVVNTDSFECELAAATPVEEVLDDREARHRYPQSAAEGLQQRGPNVGQNMDPQDPARA
jgi:hypothetical protein